MCCYLSLKASVFTLEDSGAGDFSRKSSSASGNREKTQKGGGVDVADAELGTEVKTTDTDRKNKSNRGDGNQNQVCLFVSKKNYRKFNNLMQRNEIFKFKTT